MSRGEKKPVGSVRVAKNGYQYIKLENGNWKLRHHIIAEETLGRPIDTKHERVVFADRNRQNFDPANIVVEEKKGSTPAARRAQLEARRDEIDAQLAELDEEAAV